MALIVCITFFCQLISKFVERNTAGKEMRKISLSYKDFVNMPVTSSEYRKDAFTWRKSETR